MLRPGSTAEVAAILRLASETGTPIVPQGGNTGLVGGQIPFEDGADIVVSLGRLDKIRNVDPEGNTLIAEAGVTLQRVQDAADDVDRLFPLSLASRRHLHDRRQSLDQCRRRRGARLWQCARHGAGAGSGAGRAARSGTACARSARTIRATTSSTCSSAREGTLGLITAAVLKLWPKPAETTTAFVGLPSIEAVSTFFRDARQRSGPALTAFEALPTLAMTFLERHVQGARNPLASPHAWYVLMDVAGFQGEGDSFGLAERIIGSALESGLAEDAAIAQSLDQQAAMWRLRESLPDTQRLEGGSLKHDVSVPVARIPEMIERGNRLIEKAMPGARPISFGHFGDGNLHYNVSQPIGMDQAKFMRRWWDISGPLYDLVLELGGSISAEHGIGRLKREQLVKVKSPVEIEMMRGIKRALDPKDILNPGKML